jgi:uncharacterized protein (TIGR03437 family)
VLVGELDPMRRIPLAAQTSTSVQVSQSGVLSDPIHLAVTSMKPAIFTVDQSGGGAGSIADANGTINGPNNPAARGSYISIYGTGKGQTTPSSMRGQIAPADLSSLALQVSVLFGGNPGVVTFAGGHRLRLWAISVVRQCSGRARGPVVVVNRGFRPLR